MMRIGKPCPICRSPGQRHFANDRFGDNLHTHSAAVKRTAGGDVRSWDASETLRLLRGHIGTRVGSSVLIFVTPSIGAVVLAARAVEHTPTNVGLLISASAATVWTTSSLIRAHRRRSVFRRQLESSVSES